MSESGILESKAKQYRSVREIISFVAAAFLAGCVFTAFFKSPAMTLRTAQAAESERIDALTRRVAKHDTVFTQQAERMEAIGREVHLTNCYVVALWAGETKTDCGLGKP